MIKRCLPVALAIFVAACGDSPTEVPAAAPTIEAPAAAADVADGDRVYEVTIYNLTHGQPFTPPVVASHEGGIRVWRNRLPASYEVKEIAENGNIGPLVELVSGSDLVGGTYVGTAPVFPGESVTFTITGSRAANKLSWVSMLICTNDGFAGLDSFQLPSKLWHTRTRYVRGKDAGTEVNTEDFADIVPPCPALTGVESDDAGTGMSNPDLAEHDVIRPHPNVAGIADLLRSVHRWRGPVGKVMIRRIG